MSTHTIHTSAYAAASNVAANAASKAAHGSSTALKTAVVVAHHATKACSYTCQFSAGWSGKSDAVKTPSSAALTVAFGVVVALLVIVAAVRSRADANH